MKAYKINVDDELAEAVDRLARLENRPPSEYLGVLLRDWAFGAVRRLQTLTDEEILRSRAQKHARINLKASDRHLIYDRDNGLCAHCKGPLLWSETWHIDHIMPLSKGGSNELENLALSCARCNLEKAAKVPT